MITSSTSISYSNHIPAISCHSSSSGYSSLESHDPIPETVIVVLFPPPRPVALAVCTPAQHHSSHWYLLHLCPRMGEGNKHIPWLGNEQMFATGEKRCRRNFHGSFVFPFPGTNRVIITTVMPVCYSNTKSQSKIK